MKNSDKKRQTTTTTTTTKTHTDTHTNTYTQQTIDTNIYTSTHTLKINIFDLILQKSCQKVCVQKGNKGFQLTLPVIFSFLRTVSISIAREPHGLNY